MKLSSDKLARLVQSIDYFSHTDMVGSEANTKKKIVEPLLEVLGWDLLSREVRLEHPIRVGTSSGHADYALMLEGKIVVLVEAKAFDTDLSPEYSSQIISYGRVEDVRWVVLTNGRLLKIFDAKAGKTEKECLVTEIDLKDAQMRANDLNLISRESVLTGEIESAIKRLAATKQAILNLKQNKQEVSNEFKKTLVKVAGAEVETRAENIARHLADEAIEFFEKETQVSHEQGISKEIRLVARKSLASKPTGEVVLCPSRIEGVEFLIKYNAWGFVKLSKLDVPYFALYVGRPESSVLYFGEIEHITQPLKSKEDLVKIREEDIGTFEPGKRVIHLKPETLVKFKDPIPVGNKRAAPKARLYTTLENLIQANQIGDLWEKATLEYHLGKIQNPKIKKMAVELRNAILGASEDIKERITRSHIVFRTSVTFATIYSQPRGFWLSVRVPKVEFNIQELDARPQPNPKWTDIRVDDKTNLDLLIKAAKLAYQRAL